MLRVPAATAALLLSLALAGCMPATDPITESRPAKPAPPTDAALAPEPGTKLAPRPGSGDDLDRAPASNGKPRRSLLTIRTIGLRSLPVVPYEGSPDDAPGTAIQDGGVAASPFGNKGGVGPGGVGNFLITAHRTSSTRAFADLPRLKVGDRVHVVAGRTRYVYRITGTRSTSFRSERSLARQAAAVPGRPGRRPTTAMITLSTCATPEDHAQGNYWSDEFGNPEHRIDKIGELVAARPLDP